MKKNISINLQGIIFHIEEDGYDVLSRYLAEVKAHFAATEGQAEIVADIESRIAELFSARLSAAQQVITLTDVEQMMAKMGRVSDFADSEAAEEAAEAAAAAASTGPRYSPPTEPDGSPRRLYRDMAHRKIAGVAAGLAQYFRLNPLWVRVGLVVLAFVLPAIVRLSLDGDWDDFGNGRIHLGSWVVVGYIILWVVLPKRYDAPTPVAGSPIEGLLPGKRLFRDADTGKVGGVAAGLANYLHIDVVIIRVLFLLGLFLGGSAFIIYIILWIVVPEAKTPSEKLQMRGDAVTLANLSGQFQASTGQETGSSRSIGTYLEGAARGAQPAVSFIGTMIRWFIGAILLIMGISFLVSVLSLLGVTLGLLPADSVIHLDDAPANAVLRNLPDWGVWMAVLAGGIPALALIFLGLRLFLRRPLVSRMASLSLLGLWIVGVIGTAIAGVQVAHQFRSRGSNVTTRTLAPGPYRTITLSMEDMNNFLDHADLQVVAADSSAAISLEQEVTARGSSRQDAERTATAGLDYDVLQRDSVLTFDEGPRLRPNATFRAQQLQVTIHLPLGRTYRLADRFADRLPEEFFVNNERPAYDGYRRFRLRRTGVLECLDCVPADGLGRDRDEDTRDYDSDNDREDDKDAVVTFGEGKDKMRIRVNTDGDDPTVDITPLATEFAQNASHYGTGRKTMTNPEGFTEIKASGNFRVLVRQGSAYSVEASGEADDLRDVQLSVEGDRLIIRRKSKGTLLFGLNFNPHPVLVRVTTPSLTALRLTGACRADVAGFTGTPLEVEGAGACTANLDVNTPNLSLDLAGACHVTATGRAENLDLDGAGACVFAAPTLEARTADVDLAGGSTARLKVTETLKADAAGASTIEYSGNPKDVDSDASGASRVKRI